MKLGKTNQRVLEVVRREHPATLSMLMQHLGDMPKKTVRSALQNMRHAGWVRVENNGRLSVWMPTDVEPPQVVAEEKTDKGRKRNLSEWLKSRLENNTVEGDGDCLIWKGHVAASGAPVIFLKGQRLYLRRLIWRELNDREAPANMIATSTCRTHGCCNPAHVVLVSRTTLQNQEFAEGKRPKGEAWSKKMALVRQSRSKIDWDMVRRIRACSSLMEAVRMSGLPKGNVAQIWMRNTWRNDPHDIWSSVFMRLVK